MIPARWCDSVKVGHPSAKKNCQGNFLSRKSHLDVCCVFHPANGCFTLLHLLSFLTSFTSGKRRKSTNKTQKPEKGLSAFRCYS